MSKKLHGGADVNVIAAFHAVDLGAPFRVILNDCIVAKIDSETGEMLDYTIPDFEGLVRTVVMARLVNERKLNGAELKYLRKATGIKQVQLAQVLDCQPEHLSKVESGKHPLSPTAEKVARLFLFKAAAKHHKMPESEEKTMLDNLLDQVFSGLKPVAAFDAEELEFQFFLKPASVGAANDDEETGAHEPQHCAWSKELMVACG